MVTLAITGLLSNQREKGVNLLWYSKAQIRSLVGYSVKLCLAGVGKLKALGFGDAGHGLVSKPKSRNIFDSPTPNPKP